ncbi:MAG: restriction endonuclease subunit M, partial [Mycoplasma sp.]|nr:restriction endonuclease subunit M [Mycoplasma sp.]
MINKISIKKCDDLKSIFKEIHSYISAHIVGSTQGFNIAENLIKVLFCKIYDERYKEDNEVLEFFALDSNESYEVKYRIFKIFEKVKNQYSTVFDKSDLIDFSADLIAYIVNRLKYISLMESQRDSIADAFEVFIGNALKGEHGQFFTPRNVIRFILKYIDKNFMPINSKMKIMDPACGTGGFIVEALDFVWKKINISNKNELQKQEEKINFAQTKIYGIDKDKFVAKVTKAYMCILGDGTSNVSNKDSLQFLEQHYNTVDLLLTNPPFGKKIKIKDTNILNNYILKSSGQKGTNPEVLFIELSVKLLKENGIMAIVVPEGII